MGLVDRHIELINRLYDEDQKPTPSEDCQPIRASTWQGIAGATALRPLSATLAAWREHTEDCDERPRMALIVRLERDDRFRSLLRDVCERPRRVLTRQRQMLGIDRLQEIDPACMRWIVRQPGVSLAQKAGVRQEVLGVVRLEDADTAENRVIRDLVRRAIDAAGLYIWENRRFANHERVQRVRRFRNDLRVLLTKSAIAEVRPLVGLPSPNYVLQQDSRYVPLWEVYQKLVKQQTQQDEVWRWRHRLYAEHLGFAVLCILERVPGLVRPDGSDVGVRQEQSRGTFVDRTTQLDSWALAAQDGQDVIDIILAEQLDQHPLIPPALAQLSPDILLLRRPRHGGGVVAALAVWSMLDFAVDNDMLAQRCKALSGVLGELSLPCMFGGLLLQPRPPESSSPMVDAAFEGNTRALRLDTSSSSDLGRLQTILCETLDLGVP